MSAGDPLLALEDWVAPLLAKLSPAERRGLARKIAQQLRRSQASRVASQRNPDGSAYEPRKAGKARQQGGKIRGRMFRKITTAQHLKAQADEDGAVVRFLGRSARIARIHQFGLLDAVKPGGRRHRYVARELLGFLPAERESIREAVLSFLSQGR